MGATFSRLKNWIAEVLNYADLNAEIDNILNNLTTAGVDDYSTNATQMRLTTDPGEPGAESLATSLAGELERIRFVLKEIKGGGVAQWYESASSSLTDLVNAVGGGLSDNRISSGKTTGNSSQLVALDPNGAATSLVLDGTPTNFVYFIDGVQYTISTDVTVSGLSAAPSSNNTTLVNDALAADDQFTMNLGEYGTTITVDAMGTEISNRIGQYAAFSVNNGASTEYFIAYINSSTELTRAWRGCFFNSSQAAVPKVFFSDNDVITLLRLTWVFATTAGALAVTYSVPSFSSTEPSAPATGDYWYDITNATWKSYSSTSWVAANATLIGMCAQTSTACVAARTFDSAAACQEFSNVDLEWVSNTVVQTTKPFVTANVFGDSLNYGVKAVQWDMASHLDSGLVEAASTYYYLYLKENGNPVISDLQPSDMRGSRRGLYHPSETWRCFGVIKNNGSSNLDAETIYTFRPYEDDQLQKNAASLGDSSFRIETSVAGSAITFKLTDRIGNYPSDLIPTYLNFRNGTITSGQNVTRQVRKMHTVTIPSTATMGHGVALNQYIYLYAVSDTALSLAVNSIPVSTAELQSPTAIGTGSDDSGLVGTAATTKPVCFLARAKWNTGVNGTWTAPDQLVVGAPFNGTPDHQVFATWDDAVPGGDTRWLAIGGSNAVLLGPGDWYLVGQSRWVTTANVNAEARIGFFGADGDNTGTGPAEVTTLSGVSVLGGLHSQLSHAYNSNVVNDAHHVMLSLRLTRSATIYLDVYTDNSGNGLQVDGRIIARRVGLLP